MIENPISRPIVLVLNRNWQAIDVSTPAHAFCQLMTGAATALNVVSPEEMYPTAWEDWMELSVRSDDFYILTVRGKIRIPTVIVLARYAKMPMRRPKLSSRSIRERDGNRCQYTGQRLRADEGSVDHIVPRSRGGSDSWENCVWASKKVNSRKGSRLPSEAGLTLLKTPGAVREMPATAFIRNTYDLEEWKPFLNMRAFAQ